MSITLGELAERMAGRVKGDPTVQIHCVKGMDEAGPGAITFLSNPKYIRKLGTTRASAIIVSEEFADLDRNLLIVDNPYLVFARTTAMLVECKFKPEFGVSQAAVVHPTAQVGSDVAIYPYAYVNRGAKIGDRVALYPGVYVAEECEIGDETVVFSNTVLYPRTVVGQRCVIHANVVIGSAGFGYAPDGHKWEKVPQVCRAVIGDDVEIGANTTINRGALRDTIVGRGTKIDSQVVLSHGVQVGEDCLFVSQAGVAGSATIGNRCTFGGQAAVNGHVTVGDDVTAGGRTGVAHDMEGNQTVWGTPAIDIAKARRCAMLVQRLPEMRDEIRALCRQVEQLEAKLAQGGQ